MSEHVLTIADNFWNIRGVFKIGGLLDIGTHASLVRCNDGNFLMLDGYTLQGSVKEQVDKLTNNGRDLKAILNLHPFHTVHVQQSHEQYPKALLYGTRRHRERFPDLPWQPQLCETDDFATLFAADLDFSVPAGVDFISNNDQVHFSSVLAYHRASKTMHVDDTFMFLNPPGLLKWIIKPQVKFHMTLPAALQKRSGAADEFMTWATQLIEKWSDVTNLCAAHSSIVQKEPVENDSLADDLLNALERVTPTLKKHKRKYG